MLLIFSVQPFWRLATTCFFGRGIVGSDAAVPRSSAPPQTAAPGAPTGGDSCERQLRKDYGFAPGLFHVVPLFALNSGHRPGAELQTCTITEYQTPRDCDDAFGVDGRVGTSNA